MTQPMKAHDAIAVIALCAIQADDRIKPVELKRLISLMTLSPLYRHIEDPASYLAGLNREYAGKGIETVLDLAITALSPRLRETAYAWACGIVAADLGVSQEEHAYLSLLVKKMAIPGELAGKIAAVVAILNRQE